MVAEPKTIPVTAETDLPRLLDEAAVGPVILERDGVRFRLSRDEADDDPWADDDPVKVRAALREFAGIITPEEAERWKEAIYRAREEGTSAEADAKAVREALAETAGSWADLDIDRVVEELHEARCTGSPAPRCPDWERA